MNLHRDRSDEFVDMLVFRHWQRLKSGTKIGESKARKKGEKENENDKRRAKRM